jgi:hypothetical protein
MVEGHDGGFQHCRPQRPLHGLQWLHRKRARRRGRLDTSLPAVFCECQGEMRRGLVERVKSKSIHHIYN